MFTIILIVVLVVVIAIVVYFTHRRNRDLISKPTKKVKQQKPTKTQQALTWVKNQTGERIQHCNTDNCKYNSNKAGSVTCSNPDPEAEAGDIVKGKHEARHPLWIFYCMRFVRTAYGMPAEYPKAIDMYKALKQSNLVKTDTNIPEGAIVFWYWDKYGHIGIYVGNNNVIHTGLNRGEIGIRESPLQDITDKLKYLGWAYPPDHWLK